MSLSDVAQLGSVAASASLTDSRVHLREQRHELALLFGAEGRLQSRFDLG
jgi:hypothetical protein